MSEKRFIEQSETLSSHGGNRDMEVEKASFQSTKLNKQFEHQKTRQIIDLNTESNIIKRLKLQHFRFLILTNRIKLTREPPKASTGFPIETILTLK